MTTDDSDDDAVEGSGDDDAVLDGWMRTWTAAVRTEERRFALRSNEQLLACFDLARALTVIDLSDWDACQEREDDLFVADFVRRCPREARGSASLRQTLRAIRSGFQARSRDTAREARLAAQSVLALGVPNAAPGA